ncbi:15547_t:CDS:2, partial [Dentiscutata heterogama]
QNCTTSHQLIATNLPVYPLNNANLQEALLVLMSLLQQTAQPKASEECFAYLGFTAEDTSIFALAEVEIRKHNPIETHAKKRKVEEEKAVLVKEIPGNNKNKEESQPTLVSDNDYEKERDYDWNQEEVSSNENEIERDKRNLEEELLTPIDFDTLWNEKEQFEEFLKSTSEILPVDVYDEISDLFDFYFDEETGSVIKYNIDGLPETQKEQ